MTYRERLLELRQILVELDPEGPIEFDMRDWWKCGTAACALGFACAHPPFNRLGLHLSGANGEGQRYPVYREPQTGLVCRGYVAATVFFGGEARRIFDPSKYRKRPSAIEPHHVIARIDEILG